MASPLAFFLARCNEKSSACFVDTALHESKRTRFLWQTSLIKVYRYSVVPTTRVVFCFLVEVDLVPSTSKLLFCKIYILSSSKALDKFGDTLLAICSVQHSCMRTPRKETKHMAQLATRNTTATYSNSNSNGKHNLLQGLAQEA